MGILNLSDKFRSLYIHRKNKDLIEAETKLDAVSGKVVHTIFRSNNGLAGEILKDGIFSKDQLPLISDNLLMDKVNLSKYLSKNGYKSVTKLKQTKDGVKFG